MFVGVTIGDVVHTVAAANSNTDVPYVINLAMGHTFVERQTEQKRWNGVVAVILIELMTDGMIIVTEEMTRTTEMDGGDKEFIENSSRVEQIVIK